MVNETPNCMVSNRRFVSTHASHNQLFATEERNLKFLTNLYIFCDAQDVLSTEASIALRLMKVKGEFLK